MLPDIQLCFVYTQPLSNTTLQCFEYRQHHCYHDAFPWTNRYSRDPEFGYDITYYTMHLDRMPAGHAQEHWRTIDRNELVANPADRIRKLLLASTVPQRLFVRLNPEYRIITDFVIKYSAWISLILTKVSRYWIAYRRQKISVHVSIDFNIFQ